MWVNELTKINLLMKDVNVDQNFSPAHAACLHKAEQTGKLAGAKGYAPTAPLLPARLELLGAPCRFCSTPLKYEAGTEKKTFIVLMRF